MRYTSSAISTASARWLTTTTAPPPRARARSASRMTRPLASSRLPVGSSASSSGGIVQHRATEGHALLLAAGELGRIVVLSLEHAESGRAARARDAGPRGRSDPRSVRPAARCRARSARARAGTTGRRSRPSGPRARLRADAPERAHPLALPHQTSPPSASSSRPSTFSSVLLPHPEGPQHHRQPSGWHVEIHGIEHRGWARRWAPDRTSRAARASSTAADRLRRRQAHDAQRGVPGRRHAEQHREHQRAAQQRGENRKSCWPVRAAQPSTAAPRSSASATPSAPPVSVTASASPSTSRAELQIGGAQRALDAEVADALEHGGGHRVGEREPADDQAERADADEQRREERRRRAEQAAQLARDLHVDAGHRARRYVARRRPDPRRPASRRRRRC